MPTVRFGGKKGRALEFKKSPDLLALRTRSGRSTRSGPVVRPERAVLDEMELLFDFPDAGVEVYRRKAGGTRRASRGLAEIKTELQAAPDTRFAGGVFVETGSGEPVIYTENFFIKFEDDCSADRAEQIIQEAGLTVKRTLPYARNLYFVEAPEGTGSVIFDTASELLAKTEVELCHPELVRRRRARAIAPQQWHLQPATVAGQAINAHANVAAAHALTRGEGVTIAVVDDGFDLQHEEFSRPGKIVAPRDVTRQSNDPRPSSADRHGQACAGVACADGRLGASGVAPGAKLMPIRLASGIGSQAEADAFVWAADNGADIISCSWGPTDGAWFDPTDPAHTAIVPISDSTRLAIEHAIKKGRGGKGCVILFAAGNGNERVENDGYASYPKVIAVAACNDRGKRSVYSDFGAAVFCSFPSNDFAWPAQGRPEPLTPGIWTTDRSGPTGYNPGDVREGDVAGNYTNSFGGTSSACPGAAGVAALVLSRNANLRWDEVREVLRRSCDKIDPQGGAYDAQGRSRYYGYGRLNAETAARLAIPSNATNTIVLAKNFKRAIRDGGKVKVTLNCADAAVLTAVKVNVDLAHTFIGDLIVRLHAPTALKIPAIVLHNRTGGGTDNLKATFDALNTPKLATLAGKTAAGEWALEVEDKAAGDEGQLRHFGLELVLVDD